MSNSCNHDLLHARGGEDLAKIYFRASICHHSDFFILEFKGYSAVQYMIELFATEVDLSDTNQ